MKNHHAYFYTATSISESNIPDEIKHQSTDVHHYIFDSFGVDESRTLIHQSSQKALKGSYHTFVLQCNLMTTVAQNALLKLFEEPPEGTQFYLVMRDRNCLIQTLQSRLFFHNSESNVQNNNFTDFLSCTYGERLDTIVEKIKIKDTFWIQDIVDGAQIYATKIKKKSLMKSVVLVGTYIQSSGSSKKILLEELAIALPVKKQ